MEESNITPLKVVNPQIAVLVLQVRPITTPQTYPLRHQVLRPDRPFEAAKFEGDEDPQTQHFGVFADEQLVGVSSLFLSPLPKTVETDTDNPEEGREDWQLRGMAIDPSFQKAGLGKALLNGLFEFIAKRPQALLWCNSRSEAVGFYQRSGFETRGEEFVIPDVGPHFVMVYNPTAK